MQINDPTRINDWNIENFLTLVLGIQLAMYGLIGIDLVGLDLGLKVQVLRWIIGFVYLSFIPGFALLRILRLHKMSRIKTVSFSVGLSISFLMLVGLFTNLLYPMVSTPLSPSVLVFVITTAVLLLCVLSYHIDRNFSAPTSVNIARMYSLPTLFLVSLPLLSILGTTMMIYSRQNSILSFLIVVISILVVLVTLCRRLIPVNLYPLMIVVIAVSLLFHVAFTSEYLMGADIHLEYYVFRLTYDNSHWDTTISFKWWWTDAFTFNSMLSITVLPTIYSHFLGIDGTWIFKIVYPLFFSLVPLGLYSIYRKQTSELTAFLATFLFMSHFTFYTEMLGLARQMIAELFFVLLMLLILDREISRPKRSIRAVFVIFIAALVVSHYSLTYLFIFYIFVTWLLLNLAKNVMIKKISVSTKGLSGIMVLICFAIALSWYTYISNSAPLEKIGQAGERIYGGIFAEILRPETASPLLLKAIGIEAAGSLGREIYRMIFYVIQLFTVVGFVSLITKNREMKFSREYISMTITSLAIVAMCILPYFSSSLDMARIYHITSLFLAPLSIVGGKTIFRATSKSFESLLPRQKIVPRIRTKMLLVSVILAMYFMFNTGLIFDVTGDTPSSIPLSLHKMLASSDVRVKVALYNCYVPKQDVLGAIWLSQSMDKTLNVYADLTARYNVLNSYGMMPRTGPRLSSEEINENAYVYLRLANVVDAVATGPAYYREYWNIREASFLFVKDHKIYSNGGCEIYKCIVDNK